MVRWMCVVSLKNRISGKELNEQMGVVCVADMVIQCGGLRWFGHLERKERDKCVSASNDNYFLT